MVQYKNKNFIDNIINWYQIYILSSLMENTHIIKSHGEFCFFFFHLLPPLPFIIYFIVYYIPPFIVIAFHRRFSLYSWAHKIGECANRCWEASIVAIVRSPPKTLQVFFNFNLLKRIIFQYCSISQYWKAGKRSWCSDGDNISTKKVILCELKYHGLLGFNCLPWDYLLSISWFAGQNKSSSKPSFPWDFYSRKNFEY